MCADLLTAANTTGRQAALADCVPALYLERLRPGGRLDTWYRPDTNIAIGPTVVTVADLARMGLIIDGVTHRIDLGELIADTRRALAPSSRWMTAITQGDPTEPNIGQPRLWLDFEHAGRNTLAGDVAILLWYLLGMGGWLVPTYQPATYRRTLRHHLNPISTPRARHLALSAPQRHLEVSYEWNVGAGRAAALTALAIALRGQLGAACAEGHANLMYALRPYLICRILGVIDLCAMAGADTVVCLAKLAQLRQPGLTLDDLLADLHPPTEAATGMPPSGPDAMSAADTPAAAPPGQRSTR
ncbi:hypothetical protein [Luedemannella helvata]|uniref:Uncharacterized protein n=1 Tax=Luedemannella helvata TaxID=349315 RepID=A0ABP4X9J9_9ACTN